MKGVHGVLHMWDLSKNVPFPFLSHHVTPHECINEARKGGT